MNILLYGLITGMLFGFLMQRSRVARYDFQVGLMRLKDLTVLKFMLSAIATGMVGVYLLYGLGLIELSIKPVIIGANIIGGLVFGTGWALLGYCPGTAAAALGEGRWDALAGIAGMLSGAALFARLYPGLKDNLLSWGNLGKITLAELTGIFPWALVSGLVLLILILFRFWERTGR